MARKGETQKHLGRGLASLLGPIKTRTSESRESIQISGVESIFPSDKDLRESLKHISIDKISPNPYQVRTEWNEQELSDLSESIKSNGLIQPIIVRPSKEGYELIAGERRFRASQLASLENIPALVRQANDEEMLELALIENIHRKDLNPIERAKGYQQYIRTFSLTQAQASQRLGEDRSVIANYLRLLDLPEEIKQMLIDSRLMMGHARAILSLPTDELRRKLANRALAGRLSVREIERLVRKCIVSKSGDTKPANFKSAQILDLENQLSSELGTKVRIETRRSGQRGRIIIEFSSLDEFDRIAEQIGLASTERV